MGWNSPPASAASAPHDLRAGAQRAARPGQHDRILDSEQTQIAVCSTFSLIAFLESLERRYPKLELRLICDNYGTRKHPAVKRWLAARPRFHPHFTPTSASWLNLVERWFALIAAQAIRRGSFTSAACWLGHWNDNAKPFRWTKSAADIKHSLANATVIYETCRY